MVPATVVTLALELFSPYLLHIVQRVVVGNAIAYHPLVGSHDAALSPGPSVIGAGGRNKPEVWHVPALGMKQ